MHSSVSPVTTEPTPLAVAAAPAEHAVVELRPLPEARTTATVRVYARLSNGERIEVGAHAEEGAAKAEATALMRFLREAGGDWPFLSGRFVRPEAIVSVDVEAG